MCLYAQESNVPNLPFYGDGSQVPKNFFDRNVMDSPDLPEKSHLPNPTPIGWGQLPKSVFARNFMKCPDEHRSHFCHSQSYESNCEDVGRHF